MTKTNELELSGYLQLTLMNNWIRATTNLCHYLTRLVLVSIPITSTNLLLNFRDFQSFKMGLTFSSIRVTTLPPLKYCPTIPVSKHYMSYDTSLSG